MGEVVSELSKQMTYDFGKGYDISNLKRIRKFYLFFPKGATVWHQLIC